MGAMKHSPTQLKNRNRLLSYYRGRTTDKLKSSAIHSHAIYFLVLSNVIEKAINNKYPQIQFLDKNALTILICYYLIQNKYNNNYKLFEFLIINEVISRTGLTLGRKLLTRNNLIKHQYTSNITNNYILTPSGVELVMYIVHVSIKSVGVFRTSLDSFLLESLDIWE